MKKLLICVFLAFGMAAQPPTEPPIMIQLVRKPGTTGNAMRRYAGIQSPVTVLGMTAVTGPSETWHVEAHNSFATIEDLNEAIRAAGNDQPEPVSDEVLSTARTLIAVYRPGLSYRPDQAIRMFGKARYFQISLYRIRPGTEASFAELLKVRKDNLDSINLDRPDIAYQVMSGASSATFLLLAPLASLKTLDDALANARGYAEAGSKIGKIASETEVTRSHLLFRIEPRFSLVSDEFASEAPDFWRGKSGQ